MSSSRRNCRDSRFGENNSSSGSRSARRIPAMLTRGFWQGVQQRSVPRIEEVDPLDGLAVDFVRPGDAAEGTGPGREVVQGRQMGEVAPVAAEQNLAQVDQAVDGLLDRCEFPDRRALPVFHLSVVLEETHIDGGDFDAQHDTAL